MTCTLNSSVYKRYNAVNRVVDRPVELLGLIIVAVSRQRARACPHTSDKDDRVYLSVSWKYILHSLPVKITVELFPTTEDS